MEKEICRRHLSSREGIGCVWVFMSMFDFRHGGSDQKLLMDKKRGSKRILGNNEMLETNQLTCDCDYEGMQSVKELIEEEIDEKTKTCSRITDDHTEHSDDDDDDEEKFSELIKRLISHKDNDDDSQRIVILKPESITEHKIKRSGRFGFGFLRRFVRKNPCNTLPDQDTEIVDSNTTMSEVVNKKSMSGIYITAKKHLSEMLGESDVDMDLTDKEVPRILLGKILSRPEFSTPTSSPRVTLEHDSVVSGDIEEEEEEKRVVDSLYEAQDAYVDEDEHKQPLEKETFEYDRHSPCSPPNASVRMSECQENATDVLGKSSPVSVLDPLFTDDELSPNCSKFSSVERRMQPLCIRFDEPDESPKPKKENDVKDDKELTLAYIQSLVESSDLNWEEVLARSFYSEQQFLEQALMDETDFFPTKLCNDKKLLFDCINEVLTKFCGHGPWISFVKPEVRFENVVEVVQEEVYWHLLPLPCPHTLDQIVRKDMARAGDWMDLSFDIGCIGFETGEMILDELLQEVISNYTDLVQS